MNIRCDECGLYGCRHNNPRFQKRNSSVVSLATADRKTPTIPMGSSEEKTRVIIPPPALVPTNVGPTSSGAQTLDLQKDWVSCGICKGKVYVPYLDQHLKIHLTKYQPDDIKPITTSTSIVRVAPSSSPDTTTTTTIVANTSSTSSSSSKPNLDKLECYKFRPLEQVCFASSVSQNGRFSDFTIVLWEKEYTVAQSGTYAGTSTYTSKEWERFSIHIVYDSLEEYYTLSCKLLKRGGFSSWDTEETIPDRICLQDELFGEIKRALLFFKISPKVAFIHFRKLMKSDFVIEYDNDGKALMCQTKNCSSLSEKLKKSSGYSGNEYHGFAM